MSIDVTCPECGESHQVNDRLAGRAVNCPSCDAPVDVPESVVDESILPASVVSESLDIEPSEVKAAEVEPVQFERTSPDSVGPASVQAGAVDGAAAQPLHNVSPMLHGDDEDDDDGPVLSRGNRPEEEMDMTPMVDVTFLLLIFFMVTAAFSLQKSIDMPRQQTDAPSTSVTEEESDDLDAVDLEIDEFGSFLVMAPDWERETPGKQNLITALREAIAGNKDGMRLAIKVHEMAKLKALVDGMDAGTIAGFSELEVTQVEDFD